MGDFLGEICWGLFVIGQFAQVFARCADKEQVNIWYCALFLVCLAKSFAAIHISDVMENTKQLATFSSTLGIDMLIDPSPFHCVTFTCKELTHFQSILAKGRAPTCQGSLASLHDEVGALAARA